MAYTDQARLVARLGDERFLRLFDRDGDGVADAGVIAGAIAYAEAIIDAKLAASHGARFDDPGPVPEMIAVCATDLAIGWAGMAFPGGGTAGERSPYAAMQEAAMKFLAALATDRSARLPDTAPLPSRSAESYVEVDDAPQWSPKTGGF